MALVGTGALVGTAAVVGTGLTEVVPELGTMGVRMRGTIGGHRRCSRRMGMSKPCEQFYPVKHAIKSAE